MPARELASLIGKIISMSLALGPVTRMMTRKLYAVLNSRVAWCHKLTLSSDASQEIDFWISEIKNFNGSIFGLSRQQSESHTQMPVLRDMVAIWLNMETW